MKNPLAFTMLALLASMPAFADTACRPIVFDGKPIVFFGGDSSVYSYDLDGAMIDEGLGLSGVPDDISFGFFDYGSGFHTGTIDLAAGDNANYATCTECILIGQDSDLPNGLTPDKYFFQTRGTLTIDPTTPPGSDPINLSWSNVRLVEVTLEPVTFFSTPVVNGECLDVVPDKIFLGSFETPTN